MAPSDWISDLFPDIITGPIDNSHLLPGGTWTYRQGWYTGGPAIALDVFKDRQRAGVAVTSKYCVHVLYKDEKKELFVHRFEKVSTLRELAVLVRDCGSAAEGPRQRNPFVRRMDIRESAIPGRRPLGGG
jgi:hypothetical protein